MDSEPLMYRWLRRCAERTQADDLVGATQYMFFALEDSRYCLHDVTQLRFIAECKDYLLRRLYRQSTGG